MAWRYGPHSIVGDNLVIRSIRLWSARGYEREDGIVIKAGVQRLEGGSWLAGYEQAVEAIEANTGVLLTGQNPLNYPLQRGDILVAEWDGNPVSGLAVEFQLTRVGSVSEPTTEVRRGVIASRDIERPLFSANQQTDEATARLARQINESGVPDVSIPIYLFDEGKGDIGFLDLVDTPDTYEGSEHLYLRVKDDGSGLEYWDPAFIEQPDTPPEYTGEARKMLSVDDGESALVFADEPMRWRGIWHDGGYKTNDVVVDGVWTMIANKDTFDHAAPQPVGSPTNNFAVDPTFADVPYTGVVYTGHKFTIIEPGWLKRLRVKVPKVAATTTYRFQIINITDPANPIYATIEDPILIPGEWVTLSAGSTIVGAGDVIAVVIDALDSGGSTAFTGGWRYDGTSNADAPETWGWNRRIQNDIVRIDKTDLAATDRSDELLGIEAGSTLRFAQSGAPENFLEYRVLAVPIDAGSFITFSVELTTQGGTLAADIATTMDATIPIPEPTRYDEEIDYYLTHPQPDWATVVGYKEFNGVSQPAVENNAYGIEVTFQKANTSPDWDFLMGGA